MKSKQVMIQFKSHFLLLLLPRDTDRLPLKNPPAMQKTWVGDLGSISGLGRSPGEEKGYPLQYTGLENSMDCIVHGVTKSRTQLSDFPFTETLIS